MKMVKISNMGIKDFKMKASEYIRLIIMCFIVISFSEGTTKSSIPMTPSHQDVETRILGYPGEKIDLCIDKRIKGQDIDHLIEPFKVKNETWCWQSEFWGKWMLSAVAAYEYKQDQELLQKMKRAVSSLIKTQLSNGYIGNYGPENQLTRWDIWGRKYSMLGLIRFYEVTREVDALEAARKIADHLITQIGPDKTNIIETGFYRGMASSSVLEPVVYLFNLTQDQKYLDFAKYIVWQWETATGPQLIKKALNEVPVRKRFPHPETWWSWENGQKAYEMMSCYDGLLELYQVTGEKIYLDAVLKTVEDIISSEINIAGSGSAFECWYGGIEHQSHPTYHTMETCVTTTWMKLCHKLWKLTLDPLYVDHIERSFFNALMASMKYDGSQIVKYSPLEGIRQAGEHQCKMNINCCNANGPRGFVMVPASAIGVNGKDIYINYYGASTSSITLPSGQEIHLTQKTGYPIENRIMFSLDMETPVSFRLLFRIPSWSHRTSLMVNGVDIGLQSAGSYASIQKVWEEGDQIEIILDLRGQVHSLHGFQAITRGPVVLARDSRFQDGFVDEASVIQQKGGFVDLELNEDKPAHIWMSFNLPIVMGTDLEGHGRTPEMKALCDFASAGNCGTGRC